jgi:uncharacterized membrane protein
MTWFSLLFSALTTTLVAAVLYAMPRITPATLPLGVSVPASRVDEPVIRLAVRRFRTAVLVAFVVCIAAAVASSLLSPAAGVIVPVLLFVVLGFASYAVARSGIARAKREEKWYEGVSVRLAADVTAGSPNAATPFGWYVAALILLAIAASIGVAVYPGLPDPLPIHWGGDGVANGFADKSVWSAFGPVMMGVGIVVFLFAISFLTRVSPARRVASDSPEVAAHRTRVQQRLAGGLLGQLALVLAFEMSVLAVISWSFPMVSWLMIANIVTLIAFMALVIVVYVVRYQRAMSVSVAAPIPTARPGSPDSVAHSKPAARPDAPDDDHFWKGGVFYVNRHDPALMVPKRFGIGWTINLGHPAGIVIGVVLLVVIAGGITLAVVSPGSRH